MKQLYFLGFWLAATSAAAQAPTLPPPTPLPSSFRSGSYQLEAGRWQAAKLRYNGVPELLVQNASDKDQEPLVLTPSQVRAFTIGRDTFDVVRNVTVPGGTPVAATFARRLFRSGNFLVAEYVLYRHQPDPPLGYRLLLDRPGGAVAGVLPLEPHQFRAALVPVVRDYQTLAAQLELDPNVLPAQLPELLAAYGRWKQNQSGSATTR